MIPPGPRGGKRRRWINRILGAALLLLASPLVAPQLLAFPYKAKVGAHRVYSEQPIHPRVASIVAGADAKVLADPLGKARPLDQAIFLTDGGWRWRWPAVSAADAFALSRPIGEPVIINHANPARDTMTNAYGARRRLTDIVAHELTHGAIRAEFGTLRSLFASRELVEGYADHVAGSSALTDAEARQLIATRITRPALAYWNGRKKVEARLAGNGGDVQKLFEEWR